ncbi:MAG: hypothetical protein ABIN67_22835 [Ferruginibacter sp.]
MTNFTRTARPLFYLLMVFIGSCNNGEIGTRNAIVKDIHQHYTIVYHEGEENLQVYAQFRAGGSNGATIALTPPGNIQFDDSTLLVDKGNPKGIFYTQQVSVENVYGEHEFLFTDMDEKKYENKFSLNTFRVDLPMSIHKTEPLHVEFETDPLQASDYIQISPVDSDSSFSVIYSGTDTTTYITIPPTDLQKQRAGQLKLAATIYRRMPLKETTPGGGNIEILYSLDPVYISLLQ